MNLQRERERYLEWIEDNPPLHEAEGWLCPSCDSAHRDRDDAVACCLPDEQDMDCKRYHER